MMRRFLPIALAAALASGCASYRNVKVKVINESTGRPAKGVVVQTSYLIRPFSLAVACSDQATTDENGIALLRGNDLRHEPTLLGVYGDFTPSYWAGTTGSSGSFVAKEAVFARKSTDIPKTPDFTINAHLERGNFSPYKTQWLEDSLEEVARNWRGFIDFVFQIPMCDVDLSGEKQ